VNTDCLKLTAHFGERHRTEDQFVADALLDLYGRREVQVGLHGAEGFGLEHRRLGSTDSTYLNEEPVTDAQPHTGDGIRIGDCEFSNAD
jgi:pSer/pThr/pTyr-binding forkhead associated (FHA) protein